jgi:hypothetical protein
MYYIIKIGLKNVEKNIIYYILLFIRESWTFNQELFLTTGVSDGAWDDDDNPEAHYVVEVFDPVLVSCHNDSFIRFWNLQVNLAQSRLNNWPS